MHFIQSYEQLILTIINMAGGQDKVVHMSAGLLIWLAGTILLGTGPASFWPLVPVSIAELANEIIDRIATGSWRWPDTLGDIAATLFWPIILYLAACRFRWLRH